MRIWSIATITSLLLAFTLHAEDGFKPLFNGQDLSGWKNVNCAPETWSVKDGMIHCTGKPTGALRTIKQYENFILELEWRHLKPGGNAGVFIWASPISAKGQPFLRAGRMYAGGDWCLGSKATETQALDAVVEELAEEALAPDLR